MPSSSYSSLSFCIVLACLLLLRSSGAFSVKDRMNSDRRNGATGSNSNTNTAAPIRFVTNKMCPFAQKAWIALELSGLSFQLHEISLYGAGGKPDWFLELNPAGTVPVLQVPMSGSNTKGKGSTENAAIFPDSDLILQAVADGSLSAAASCHGTNSNKNPLVYRDQQQEKQIKQWCQAINQMLPIGKKAIVTPNTRPQLQRYLQDKLECRLLVDETPLFLVGDQVTIADCHAFPFLWRLDQEFGLTDTLQCPKLGAWVERCCQVPAFSKTIPKASWWWWW